MNNLFRRQSPRTVYLEVTRMSRQRKSQSQISDPLASELASSSIKIVGNYYLGTTIGEGAFGKVKEARHIMTNMKVAVKIVDKTYAPAVAREILAWKQLNHPHITQFYEVLTTETRIYLVMELCSQGEIFDYLMAKKRLDETECKRMFGQLVSAIAYCHEKNIVHRDLKLENILLDEDLNVKLIDFGFMRQLDTKSLLDTFCGSLAYASPEMISKQKYKGPEVDIWSLGVILYTLVCGYLPFDSDNETTVQSYISEGKYEFDKDIPISDPLKDLICGMLIVNSKHRFSMQQVCDHPWLKSQMELIKQSKLKSTTISFDPKFNQSMGIANFISTSKFNQSKDSDMVIMQKLFDLGFESTKLTSFSNLGDCNSLTALYFLLLKKNNNGHVDSDLNSPIAQSPLEPDRLELSFKDTAFQPTYRSIMEPKRTLWSNVKPPKPPLILGAAPVIGRSAVEPSSIIRQKLKQEGKKMSINEESEISEDEIIQSDLEEEAEKSISELNNQTISSTSMNDSSNALDKQQTKSMPQFNINIKGVGESHLAGALSNEDVGKIAEKKSTKPDTIRKLPTRTATSRGTKLDPVFVSNEFIAQCHNFSIRYRKHGFRFFCQARMITQRNQIGRKGKLVVPTLERRKSDSYLEVGDSHENLGLILKKNLDEEKHNSVDKEIGDTATSEIIRFEMEIGALVGGEYGLKFKRLSGDQWHYKNLCDRILESMKLE